MPLRRRNLLADSSKNPDLRNKAIDQAMASAQKTPWSLEADYLQACNCDYGCPCEFSAPPTKGFCEGVGAWKIITGHLGDVRLDGLGFGFVARWPKAIHEGNGTVCLLFDERANPKQREALLRITTAQEGGLPFEILVTTFTKILDPLYVPMQFKMEGKHASAQMGDALRVTLEPIKNPVTGEPEAVRVEHGTGFIFKSAECLSAKECVGAVGELQFSCPDKAAFAARIHYHN